jgi:hypothetical protein
MLRSLLLVSLVVAAAGCGRDETPAPTPGAAPRAAAPPAAPPPGAAAAAPFRVSAIELGSAVAADERIAVPAASFAPTDTVYASVATEGSSPGVTLSARWTSEDGQLVHEASETIAPSGPTFTEFHVSKPSGFPAGKYQVAIAADGNPIGVKRFEIR